MELDENKQVTTLGLYSLFWRWLALAVHRYGSAPTGQTFIVITLIVLDMFEYEPTVTELAEITKLPKSSVSRYVAAEMNAGLLEEFIDPHDRRRRRLRPTAAAKAEQAWHKDEFKRVFDEIYRISRAHEGDLPRGQSLVKMMTEVTQGVVELSKAPAPKVG